MPVVRTKPNQVIVDIDTQRHFFAKNSFICVKDHRRVLGNILRLINWAQRSNIPRISTVQVIDHDHCPCPSCIAARLGQRKVGFTIRGSHTSFDATDCTDIMPGILEQYEQLIFQKRCFDPFEEPRVDRTLTELKADEFILIGAAAEGRTSPSFQMQRGRMTEIWGDLSSGFCRKEEQRSSILRHSSNRSDASRPTYSVSTGNTSSPDSSDYSFKRHQRPFLPFFHTPTAYSTLKLEKREKIVVFCVTGGRLAYINNNERALRQH